MLIKVTPHIIKIVKEQSDPINEKEINVSKCQFEFSEEIEDDYVKEAYFTLNGNTYKQIIVNNECDYPGEVLEQKGELEIGVVVFKVENEEYVKLYNPTPDYYETWIGSLKDAENSEPITPSEMEQYEQALNDGLIEAQRVDIDATKVGNTATVTITNRNGTEKAVSIYDGQKGDKGDKGDKGEQGVQGIQGPKGDTGASGKDGTNGKDGADGKDAKINGVNTLTIQEGENISISQSGSTMTISSTGGSGGTSDYEDLENKPSINNVTLSGNKTTADLGIVIPDLTDYVKNTDYATDNTGGVIKSNYGNGFGVSNSGALFTHEKTYAQYTSGGNAMVIGKGTLENVITGKGLVASSDLSSVATSGSYNDLSNKPTIPSKTSDLTNDSGFITNSALTDYVRNTDYATNSTGGVVKIDAYAITKNTNGNLMSNIYDYSTYSTASDNSFISKGTLENVLNEKIGNINTILATLTTPSNQGGNS